MSRAWLLGSVALLAIPFGPAAGHASTASLIVFSADRQPSVSGEIYVVRPNGRAVDLSGSPNQDVAPTVSSDGTKVAFVSDRTPKGAVYEVEVTLPFASVTSLSWSPDGTRFVVTARRTITSPIDLYTIRTDGADPVQLTKDFDASGASWR